MTGKMSDVATELDAYFVLNRSALNVDEQKNDFENEIKLGRLK